jgi:CHAT domain-containing protein
MLLSTISFNGKLIGLLGQLLTLPFFCVAQPQRQSVQSPGMADVQLRLRQDEALLEYFLSDSLLFILSVTNEVYTLVSQEIDPVFRKSLKEFRKKLSVADIQGIHALGKLMYTYLLSPVRKSLEGKRRLIVMPGKELSGIPFETFVSSGEGREADGRDHIHYLIFDYEIIYNYSAGLWVETFPREKGNDVGRDDKPEYAFTGFSPVFSNHPTLSPLPGAGQEVAAIGSMFRQMGMATCIITGKDSRESRFKEVANRSGILHLATHSYRSFGDDETGGFLFSGFDQAISHDVAEEGVLTGKEISGLNLDADLIVLNSCSSGLEKFSGGGYKTPLPLRFLNAGARNIISALWNVTDCLAGRFMVGFYRNWFEGNTYSSALRKMKLEMISNPETSLPSIWAPYILIGH